MNKEISNKKEILVIIISLVVLLGIIFSTYFFKNKKIEENNEITTEEVRENFFDNLNLEAKSAYVYDAKENKVLFSLNEEAQLPLASLTKLMTALVSSELVPKNTILTINESDLKLEGDSGLVAGEKWNFFDILKFTLMTSSNDGAHALASVIGYVKPRENGKTEEQMFVDEMNKKAGNISLTQTYYLNESGLDLSDGYSGAYGSAKDIAFLMAYITEKKPEILEATKYSSLEISSKDIVHSAINTNQYADSIPGIIGSKTGFTDLAGGNLVVAFDVSMGHPIIVSVLGSSVEGRFEDVERLINATINTFAE